MDLGIMLAEALKAHQDSVMGAGWVDDENPASAQLDSIFDLTAAAEAFLAKLREADGGLTYEDGLRKAVALGDEACMEVNDPEAIGYVEKLIKAELLRISGDHTGPVSSRAEVE